MFESLDTSHLIVALAVFALTVAGIAVLTPRAPRRDTALRDQERAAFRRRIEEKLDAREAEATDPTTKPDDHGTYIPAGFTRVFMILFLSGWLIGWTTGIVLVFRSLLDGGDIGAHSIFMVGWLIAAVAAWVYASYILVKLLRREPIPRPNRH